MLKFKVTTDGKIEVDENDRGEWVEAKEGLAHAEFIGFDGENTLTVIPMSMQSGIWDVVVVHSMVDSPSRVSRATGRNLDDAINKAVKRVCDYPTKMTI